MDIWDYYNYGAINSLVIVNNNVHLNFYQEGRTSCWVLTKIKQDKIIKQNNNSCTCLLVVLVVRCTPAIGCCLEVELLAQKYTIYIATNRLWVNQWFPFLSNEWAFWWVYYPIVVLTVIWLIAKEIEYTFMFIRNLNFLTYKAAIQVFALFWLGYLSCTIAMYILHTVFCSFTCCKYFFFHSLVYFFILFMFHFHFMNRSPKF